MVSPILDGKKITKTVTEIISSNLKRILKSKTMEAYGMLDDGLDLDEALFSVGADDITIYEDKIKNYIQEKIPYLTEFDVNIILVKEDNFGNFIVDNENYTNVVVAIDWSYKGESDTIVKVNSIGY